MRVTSRFRAKLSDVSTNITCRSSKSLTDSKVIPTTARPSMIVVETRVCVCSWLQNEKTEKKSRTLKDLLLNSIPLYCFPFPPSWHPVPATCQRKDWVRAREKVSYSMARHQHRIIWYWFIVTSERFVSKKLQGLLVERMHVQHNTRTGVTDVYSCTTSLRALRESPTGEHPPEHIASCSGSCKSGRSTIRTDLSKFDVYSTLFSWCSQLTVCTLTLVLCVLVGATTIESCEERFWWIFGARV